MGKELDQPDIVLDGRDFFLLLYALSNSDQEHIDLSAQRKLFPQLSQGQALSRSYLLARQFDVSEPQVPLVAEEFAKILKAAGSRKRISRTQLTAAITRAVSQRREATTPLKQFEERVRNFFKGAPLRVGVEVPDKDGSNHRSWLDLKPLTQTWPREIMKSRVWNSIESPVPDIPDLPLQDTWVNLTLRELRILNSDPTIALENEAWGELSFDNPGMGISLPKALLGIQGLTVIIGLPGAGKSTLMKWIARHVITSPECPFGIPIMISLRQYAKEKNRQPELSLFDYFLHSRGIKVESQTQNWHRAATFLLDSPNDELNRSEAFLWLLDGWDEVPVEMRDSIMTELQSVALYPSIITTRHSAEPLRLPAQRYYEIQGLKYGAALDLAYRWLVKTGNEECYTAIETGLAESGELRRLARSPFLLTLLCALAARRDANSTGGIPRRRGGVLGETLKLVLAQHNSDRKQAAKFGRRDRENISRFAFWLLSEASGSPRYVFDSHDYEAATSVDGRFERLLVPSRLITKSSVDSSDFQFVHASFQEFLAAQNLFERPERIPRHGAMLLAPIWAEIARFLAELARPETGAWRVLMEESRHTLANLDKFGIIAARISHIMAAAGERDGGKRILGIDLREHLWKILKRYAQQIPTPLLDAFLELDATDLARRILDDRIRTGKNSVAISWLQRVSVFDLEMLFTDHEKYRRVLRRPEVATYCPDLPDWIFETSADQREAETSRNLDELHRVVTARDTTAARDMLWKVIEEDADDVVFEAIQEVLKLPQDVALKLLLEIVFSDSVDELTLGKAVAALGSLGDRDSCSQVMAYLATREMDDPAILPILGSLDDYALDNREAKLISDLLYRSHDPEARCAAAELLADVRARFAAANLIEAFKIEAVEEVRLTILRSLAKIADDGVIENLWHWRNETYLTNDAEWDAWFKAVLSTLENRRRRTAAFGNIPAADELTLAVRKLAVRAFASEKDNEYSKLASAVLEYPAVLGKMAAQRLMNVARNRRFSEKLRTAAIQGLAQLESEPSVITFLNQFARSKEKQSITLKQAACDTLGVLSPLELSRLRSKPAQLAMARLAFRHNSLFFKRPGDQPIIPDQTSTANGNTSASNEQVIFLFLTANPGNTAILELDEEMRAITEKIQAARHRDQIKIEQVGAVRADDLIAAMNRHHPRVVQFSGHGDGKGKGILICDDDGNSSVVGSEALVSLFESTSKKVQLVVLNCCYSESLAQALTEVVPCVVGMNNVIGDVSARMFTANFYGALANGLSVELAFKQGMTRLKMKPQKVVRSKARSFPILTTRKDVNARDITIVTA
ncbi:MAG TPA: CHAT domain-containing protein [Pyrinomonadaceae bacterium]|nr:CHAT domain-containing protein [Pyrinomonadaceae bacterium]